MQVDLFEHLEVVVAKANAADVLPMLARFVLKLVRKQEAKRAACAGRLVSGVSCFHLTRNNKCILQRHLHQVNRSNGCSLMTSKGPRRLGHQRRPHLPTAPTLHGRRRNSSPRSSANGSNEP